MRTPKLTLKRLTKHNYKGRRLGKLRDLTKSISSRKNPFFRTRKRILKTINRTTPIIYRAFKRKIQATRTHPRTISKRKIISHPVKRTFTKRKI